MKVIVWHHNPELCDAKGLADARRGAAVGELSSAQTIWEQRCYQPVAVVTVPEDGKVPANYRYVNALEMAFEATNNIDSSWWSADRPMASGSKPRVLPLGRNLRSSMVGDVFELIDDAARYTFVVGSIGFRNLENGDAA